jgi:hypothetical protein
VAAAASISRSERNRPRGSVTPVFHQAADRDAREILSLGARGGTRVGRRGRDGEVSALSVTSARAAWTVVSRGRAVASVTTRRLDALPARERGNVPVSSRIAPSWRELVLRLSLDRHVGAIQIRPRSRFPRLLTVRAHWARAG